MGKIGQIITVILFVALARGESWATNQHFLYGTPTGTPKTNNLIVREIYTLSSNDTTKFADWVAYRLDKETIGRIGRGNRTNRVWKADPLLKDEETLEPEDYKDAYKILKVDRGHQAPLANFKGTPYWADTNYLSNITPQKADLNRGPWKILEEKERELAEKGFTVYVLTGTLYERPMPSLPKADEPHKIPSGYWKIILIQEDMGRIGRGNRTNRTNEIRRERGKNYNTIKSSSFIFDQETPKTDKFINHLTTINEIEKRTGFDFLWELPDNIEEKIESEKGIYGTDRTRNRTNGTK